MAELVGKTLAHYRVVRELGSGGMGQVFLAEDTRLRRPVALKVLPPALANDRQYLERFEREATAVAALNHPNIVTIFSIEKEADPPFLTMELVDGETLTDRIPDSGMALDDFLDVAIPLADALSAAHAQGIVHRDLKPGNVMISREGRVKILDFGLAKRTMEDSDASSDDEATMLLTREGAIVGTAPYMSPEQVQGVRLDHRSDIFSLGIILHEMLTGERPFRGQSSAALISSILRDEPPPVSEVKVDLPRHLARIVRRCLEKNVVERYQTALDVRNELVRLRREIETGELTGSVVAEGKRGARLPRPGKALLRSVVAGLVVGGALVAAWWFGRSGGAEAEDGPRRIVVLPFENLGSAEDAYFAAGITEEITSRLASVRSLRVISRRSAQHYADSDRPITEIGAELGVDFALAGSVRWASGVEGVSRVRITPELIRVEGGEQMWSTQFDRDMEDIFGVQTEIARSVVAELGVEVLQGEEGELDRRPTENVDAYQAYLRGLENRDRLRFEERQVAQRLFERAVELDPDFVEAWAELTEIHGFFYFAYDRTPERRAAFAEALDTVQRLAPNSPEARLAQGSWYYSAERDLRRALGQYQELVDERPHDVEALKALGRMQRGLGRLDEAVVTLERARSLDPKDSSLLLTLVQVLQGARRLEEGEALIEELIAAEPDSVGAYSEKASIVGMQGDLERWRAVLEEGPPTGKVAFLIKTAQGPDWMERRWDDVLRNLDLAGVDLMGSLSRIGFDIKRVYALRALGRDEEAAERLDSAEELTRQGLEARPDDPTLHSFLGRVLALRGDEEAAIEAARRGIDLADEQDVWNNTWRKVELARVLSTCGRAEEAAALLVELLDTQYRHPLTRAQLKLDPIWDPIRDHPAFGKLVAGGDAPG